MLIRSVLLRLTLAPILILFTLPQLTIAASPVLPTPTEINAVQGFFSRPVVVPEPPDMTSNYQALVQAQTACDASGGRLDGLLCVLPPPPVYVAPVVYSQPEDWYKAWIYNEESGDSPTRWNTSGCLGLGQACPASKLLAVCPNEDYACEDGWFTDYMLSSYGSWQNAYYFHLANNWW